MQCDVLNGTLYRITAGTTIGVSVYSFDSATAKKTV